MKPDEQALVEAHFSRDLSELEAARLERLVDQDDAAAALFLALAERDHRAKGLGRPRAAWRAWALAASALLGLGLAWLSARRPAPGPVAAAVRVAPAATPAAGLGVWVDLDGPASLQAVIVDGQGRVLRRLSAGLLPRGRARLAWDGRDEAGRPVPAGRYRVRITRSSRPGTEEQVLDVP